MAPSNNCNHNHGHGHGHGNRNSSSSVPPSRPLRHRGHDHGPRRLGLQIDLPAVDASQWNGKTALSVTEAEGEDDDGNVYGDDGYGNGDDDIVFDDNYQDDDGLGQDDDDGQDVEDHYDDNDEAEDSFVAPRMPPKAPKFVLPMLPPSAEKETGAQDSMEAAEDELPDADVATLVLTPPLFAASSSSSMAEEPTTMTTMMISSAPPPERGEEVEGEEQENWNSNSTTDSNWSSEFESIPAPPIALDAVEAETVLEAEGGVEPGGVRGYDIGVNGDSAVVAEEETNQQPYQEGDWREGDVHGTLLENKMDDEDNEKAEEMEPVVAEEKEEEGMDGEATKDVALLAGAEGETEAETIVDETNATGDNNEEQELEEEDFIVDNKQEAVEEEQPEEQEEEQEELVEEEKEKEAEEEQQPPQQPQNEINDTSNEGISPPNPEPTINQSNNGSNDVPEINDQTVQPSWEGFDDIDNPNDNPNEKGEQDDPHEYEPDVDSSSSSSHSFPEYDDDQDASVPSSSFRPDELAYEGDGFHNENNNATLSSHSTTNHTHILLPLPLGAIIALATLPLLYCLFHRCRRRRFLDSQKKIDYNRGRYAAIAGGGGDYDYDDNADFFSNDFFSEDVSFRGKDSDEEEEWSVGSEEDVRGGGVNGNGNGMVRIEMGGIHETDANGGLTLEEING